MPTRSKHTERAASLILHPICLLAMLLLVVNDHYFKAAYPGWWTGKLSDFAGLTFFPCFLQAAWQYLRPNSRRSTRTQLWTASLATALVFAAIQLSPPAADAYRYGLASLQWPFLAVVALIQTEGLPALVPVHMVPDPSDLLALPAAFVWLLLGNSLLATTAESPPSAESS